INIIRGFFEVEFLDTEKGQEPVRVVSAALSSFSAMLATVVGRAPTMANLVGAADRHSYTFRFEQFTLMWGLIRSLGEGAAQYRDIKNHPIRQALDSKGVFLTPYLSKNIIARSKKGDWQSYLDEVSAGIERFKGNVEAVDLERLTEPEKTLLYNALHKMYPAVMSRVKFEGFEKSPLVESIFSRIRGEEFYLSDADIIDIINLGLDVDEKVRRYAGQRHGQDRFWITSFREQVKLHTEFVNLYLSSSALKSEGIEIKHTLEYFILCCITLYAGMFGDEIGEFKKILAQSINDNFDIFVKLSLGDTALGNTDVGMLIDRFMLESFSTLDKEQDMVALYGVKPYQQAYYSLLRCTEVGYPSLFMLSSGSHRAFDEALDKLSTDTVGEVFRMPLSHFSERSDLFGMNMPDKEEAMTFITGVIPRLIERAQANPDKPVYLVMDNIEAVQDALRVEFNPVLWERSVVVPELNKTFILPKNMHIIFTMGEESGIKDDAFLNRVSRHAIASLDKDDLRQLLVAKHGIDEESADILSKLYEGLSAEQWRQKSLDFSVQDFINSALYAKKRGAGLEILKEEAFRYLYLKFRYESDRKKFSGTFKKLAGPVQDNWRYSSIEFTENGILADGAQIGISEGLAKFVKKNPDKNFREAILEEYGYSVRQQDMRILSQIARRLAFDSEDTSRAIIIEGISGEGKTQLAQVASKILGYENLGFTIHKRSSLEELRGGIFPGVAGLYVENDTAFLAAEKKGRHIINFSELNTSYKAGLVYWLYPEFSSAAARFLPEIPAPENSASPFYSNHIAGDNIFIADINPDDYRARQALPRRFSGFSENFWVGYDYSENDSAYQKEIQDEIRSLTEGLFKAHFSELEQDKTKKYSGLLADLYYSIQRDFGAGNITSLYQVLTVRDLIRAINMFRYYSLQRYIDVDTAFKAAVKASLWFMWQEKGPQERIKAIIKNAGLWTEKTDAKAVIEDALSSDAGHLLIHSTAAEDGYDAVKNALDKDSNVSYMAVSNFIELDNIVGGVSVDLEGSLQVFPGTLLKLIEQAEAEPKKQHVLILDNFQQLNPDTAVGLNRALQEGRIEIPRQGRFAIIPANLKIIAISYMPRDPFFDDKLPMSGAELSRFVSVAMPEEMAAEWIDAYIQDRLKESSLNAEDIKAVKSEAKNIFKVWLAEDKEIRKAELRLGKKDIDEYLGQILRHKDSLNGQLIKEIAYYALGMALQDKTRELFRPKPATAEFLQSAKGQNYLCPIEESLEVYKAVFSAFEEGRRLILFEGPPGAGKTAIPEDIAKRLGVRFKKVSMYKDIDIWEFLGKIEKTGPNKFRITCSKEEGRFLSVFLDYLENGGIFCFDEANISMGSVQAVSFLTHIIRGEPVDLGVYHNGIPCGKESHRVNINPDFKVFVTFNPSESTKARKKMPLELLWLGKKIWVSDFWSHESYKKLIDYYLYDKAAISDLNKDRLVKFHIYMKYIMDEDFRDFYEAEMPENVKKFQFGRFKDIYTYQYGVSPRELIRTAELINTGNSLFEAILLNYIFQFSDPQDIENAVDITDALFPGFGEFFKAWQADLSGITVSGKDEFFAGVPSQAAALKALKLGISQRGHHTLIISEQGSYPFELVKYFCRSTGSQLHSFNCSQFLNSVELLGGSMVKFSDFNKQGAAHSSDILRTALGFIGEHLVKEGDPAADDTTGPLKVLYLSSVEVVSSEELELLNDFLNTGRIMIGGSAYALPANARIVVETSVLRKNRFSSPFYNRFQKIGLRAITDYEEVSVYFDKYYPGLTEEEKGLITSAARLAWYMDMGRFNEGCNKEHKKFSYRYGFSIKDVYRLAELLSIEKTRLRGQGVKKIDSVMAALKCVLRFYGNGLNDRRTADSSDRGIYFNALLDEVFDYEGIDTYTISELEKEIRLVERQMVSTRISAKDLSKGITLQNGITIEKRRHDIIVTTPINEYTLAEESLRQKPQELSEGLRVELDDKGILLSQSLIKSIGQMEPVVDLQYALSPEEVPAGDFIRYEGAINEAASLVFWASRRVIDASGRERPPVPVMLMGETGGAKSTFVRNLSHITGMPEYVLHCYDNMETDAFLASMSVVQDAGGRKIALSLKEFFSHLGKINGNYYYPEGKTWHSERKILFLDEANVSPEMLYCLRPLFRGERKFTSYLYGEKFTVELDPEVVLILAGNPQETHAGRKNFSWEIAEDGIRILVPAMHSYLESERVKKEDLVSILFGMHKRKMKELEQGAREARLLRQGLVGVQAKVPRQNAGEQIRLADTGGFEYKKNIARTTPLQKNKNHAGPGKRKAIKKDISFDYSIKAIDGALASIKKMPAGAQRYQYFLDAILRDFLLALGDGTAGMEKYEAGDGSSLIARVLEAGQQTGEDLFNFLNEMVSLYRGASLSYSAVKAAILNLRHVLLKKADINRFLFSFPIIKDNKLFVLVKAEEIMDVISLEAGQFAELGMDTELYKDKFPICSHCVNGHPFLEERECRGEFKGENYSLIFESSIMLTPAVGQISRAKFISWVGYHELGHLADQLRSVKEQVNSHPNIELFSVLFPMIFSKDNKEYIREEMLHLLRHEKGRDSYYCQAAKGIFNGILRVLKEQKSADSAIKDIKEISDSFEDENIDAVYKFIEGLSAEEIKKIGIKLYKDAWEKKFLGEYYLSSTGKGRYRGFGGGSIIGDTISEFTEGLENAPDVEIVGEGGAEQEEIEQSVNINSDAKEKGRTPELDCDKDGRPGAGRAGETKTGEGVVQESWLAGYYKRLGPFAKRFVSIFSEEPQEEEIYTASGRKIDVRKWITLCKKVFKKTTLDEAMPTLSMGITVDVSGSITGRRKLVKSFTDMSRFFVSLMHAAGKDNQNVRSSMSAIGEEFHRVYDFEQCKNETILEASVKDLWRKNDNGGINTINLINGLRRQYGHSGLSQANRIHIVFTDGGETSGRPFEELRQMVETFEREYEVDVIFVGIGTKEVTNYFRYLLLDSEPQDSQLMNMLTTVATEKVRRGRLPLGDLAKSLSLDAVSASATGGLTPQQRDEVLRQINTYCGDFALSIRIYLEKLN
ncbi:MAG: hypothetical protein COZ98_06515, partial [Candidatus Omnitrophica bacterium CG_4_8_14_3_um_filter_43_15]